MSSFLYHLCVLVCGAWKQLALFIWDVIAIIPLRKGNTPVLVVLHKAPLKAGTPRVNTHTTRGMSCKHHPSVHHSWLWSPCSTYTLGVLQQNEHCVTQNQDKHSALQKLSWNIPHKGRKREHKQMSMGTKTMEMSLLGQRALVRNSVFWEVSWWVTSLDSFGCIWHHGAEWWHNGLPPFCPLDKIPLLGRFLKILMHFNRLRVGLCGVAMTANVQEHNQGNKMYVHSNQKPKYSLNMPLKSYGRESVMDPFPDLSSPPKTKARPTLQTLVVAVLRSPRHSGQLSTT